MATLVLGARFPPHVNAWILLLKKGRVTMVFVGALKMWSEKSKSGKCAPKHSSPFMPTGQGVPCASKRETRMLKSHVIKSPPGQKGS